MKIVRNKILLILLGVLLFVLTACSKKEVASEEVYLLADEFWKSITEISYYDFDETVYKISDEDKIEELHAKFKTMEYKEIENPWIEGWYHFEIHTNENIHNLIISGNSIGFDGKFYKVTDSISEEVATIIKSQNDNNELVEKTEIFDFQKANKANVSFDIADPGYDFEGDDVKKIISLLKPETWEKGILTLELSAIEHIIFYKDNMKYVVAIRDVENNEVLFELYSATDGKWNSDGGYYKTNDVGYKELMDALKEMCCIQK